MSSSYSPTAEFTDSTTVLADGDAANATNLNAAPKKALDRAAYLRAATDGLLVWRGNARVDSGGASSGNTGVYCPPIEAVSLLDGSTWRAFSLSSETQLTTAAHFGGGTLAAATAYYVYAYVSGGVLALQISADAPGADGIWKNGATGTHRYLFSFFTDSSGGANGVAIPMRRTAGGRYLYRTSAIGTTALQALFGGTATSWTDLSLGGFGVPASARAVILECVLNGVTYELRVRTKGDSTSYRVARSLYGVVEIEPNNSQQVQYQVSNAALSADINVLGYEE